MIKIEPYCPPAPDFGLGIVPWDEDCLGVSLTVADPNVGIRGKLPCPIAWEFAGDRSKATVLIHPSKVPEGAWPRPGDLVSVDAPANSKWGRVAGRDFLVIGTATRTIRSS